MFDCLWRSRCTEAFFYRLQHHVPDVGARYPALATAIQAMISRSKASIMKPGDVAFVISNTGTTRSIIEIARIAHENGATVICLTGSDSPLTHYCDVR
jgi:DNA-binding MurR/RpiR family transcriptional regulator